jgi:flagellar basal body-associated protein FliL
MRKTLTIGIIVLAVVVMVAGALSIYLGQSNSKAITDQLAAQQVSLRIFDENAPADAVITNASQARLAANTLGEHLKNIAPSYSALLGGKKFDPTNPTQITYVTGMNLQGQMNLAALAFGLTTVLTFFGAIMIVIGVVLLVVGLDIYLYHIRPARAAVEAARARAPKPAVTTA